jgi:hypothetical protein
MVWDAARPIPTQSVIPGLTTTFTYNNPVDHLIASMTQTDTSTTTLPCSTNGRDRTTSFAYTAFNLALPPVVGPSSSVPV